ncbi:16S rRNA (cytidine(1402)-2'-O)-methyltransferase [Fuscovulum ytuae]|uniref:Ribosomal RNA small subunit methyltransferase I n=1 Tax=Fuscovulum ytuae TaxID=3042299 RepID=A0ABY8Q1E6_9RHOB|nr:16S rRNA (cytidine(1402)-2'-O)-methyltransferase [Fuscovulum sp. YMD61]WGV14534.1 16S rRNA (cytidine(1402)-2'-O)-methyltransferase [Fuscovulum sp. YMD61]
MTSPGTVWEKRALARGLYLVATPIGAARDITLRALDILASAEVLAAEDTRTLRHLMEIHGIPLDGRPLVPCHDHNEGEAAGRLVAAVAEGKSVAYASEAGTPLVSDPGFALARAMVAADLPVTAAPGPSAVLCALAVAGLPSDRFLFAGFPPPAQAARRVFLDGLKAVQATLVFYESPRRLPALLSDLADRLGGARDAAICRELTKRFEEVRRGPLDQLAADYADTQVKGEVVVLVNRAAPETTETATWEAALDEAMARMSVKDAAAMVAEAFDLPRRDVYQAALRKGKGD